MQSVTIRGNITWAIQAIPRKTYAFDICYPEDGFAARKDVLNPQQENLRCIVRVTDNAVDVVMVNVSDREINLTQEHTYTKYSTTNGAI